MPIELLTDTGVAKIAAAAGSGTQVAITHIALGDGDGAAYDPDGTEVALANELAREAISYRELIDASTWRAKAEFPPETPNFVVREMGFFDVDGDLIAIRAGLDLNEGETGFITYLVQHDINFSNVADGAVIVYVENPEGEAMINEFLAENQSRFDALETQYNDLIGGLQANVGGAVADVLGARIEYRPQEAAPSLVHEGWFTTWAELQTFLETLSQSSVVTIELNAGDTLENGSGYNPDIFGDRTLRFVKKGNGNNPVLKIMMSAHNTQNRWHHINPGDGGKLEFISIDIEFDQSLYDGGKAVGYHGISAAIFGGVRTIIMNNCVVTGQAHNNAFVVGRGGYMLLATYSCEFSGIEFIVDRNVSGGIAVVENSNLTLSGGTVVFDPDFTIGVNALEG